MILKAIRGFIFVLSMSVAVARGAVIHEDIGELKIHDLLLRPSFLLKEPKQGFFSIGESSFALKWVLEERFSSVIRIGPRSLLNPLARYSDTVSDEVTLVEAFAQYEDDYGRLRLGRLPVEFGLEGRMWERHLIFPRSLLFKKRAMMLRDVGASYDISHNNWYTGVTVHNGESDQTSDGRTWYTARWGFRDQNFELGLAGQTGSTKPDVTNNSNDTLANVDPTREAKWRIGGLFSAIQRRRWQWAFEFYGGELEQQDHVEKYLTGHTDFGYEFSKTYSAYMRFDFFDPWMNKNGNSTREISLAVVMSNSTKSSNLILVGTKVFEESPQIANDELRLIWSLSPSGQVRF